MQESRLDLPNYDQLISFVIDKIHKHTSHQPDAIGHRVVHGGEQYLNHAIITDELILFLEANTHLAPIHLPNEINAIKAVSAVYPDIPQAACFDTAFHRTLPTEARQFGIPRTFYEQGVRRYGFHGLSCEYIVDVLAQENSFPDRLIVAHLGHGASMTAIKNGQSIDTTMGLTPLGGLVMSTRPGDLDPGVLLSLLQNYDVSIDRLDEMLNFRSGLLGVSDRSADMKELVDVQDSDPYAAEAVTLFCHQAAKQAAGLIASLNSVDMIVFTGGIGEKADDIRERICKRLEFVGISLDKEANRNHADTVTTKDSPVIVRVIPTNEEQIVAAHTYSLMSDID